MASTRYSGGMNDDDSGIGSSTDLNSSRSTLIEPSFSSPLPAMQIIQPTQSNLSTVKISSDGFIERIRPATMKNSTNGDFIVCRTTRGTYVAHRTPIVPQWIKDLVHEIESQEHWHFSSFCKYKKFLYGIRLTDSINFLFFPLFTTKKEEIFSHISSFFSLKFNWLNIPDQAETGFIAQ